MKVVERIAVLWYSFSENGRREERAEGIIDTLISLVKDGILFC